MFVLRAILISILIFLHIIAVLSACPPSGENNGQQMSAEKEKRKMLIDIINTYYGRPDLPMGAPKGTSGVDMTLDSNGLKLLWINTHMMYSLLDAVAVYRQILAHELQFRLSFH